MKKILSVALSIVMVALMWCIPVSASCPGESQVNNTLMSGEDNLHIDGNVARYVAEFFVSDMIETGYASWDRETKVQNVVPMYDETGEIVNAYTIELDSGYVVVSAYIDMPSIILEWSDDEAPCYKTSKIRSAIDSSNNRTKIIYLGALDYYIDNGSSVLERVDGIKIERFNVSNGLEMLRDIDNIGKDTLFKISKMKESDLDCGKISPLDNSKEGDVITDVLKYAEIVYGRKWRGADYANHWEKFKDGTITESDVSNYSMACAPIAITNIIKIFGNFYNSQSNRDVLPYTGKQIFDRIKDLKNGWGRKYYVNGSGTYVSDLIEYATVATDVFSAVDIGVSSNFKKLNWMNAIETCKSSCDLMLLSLYESDTQPYTQHIAVGYAYCRIYPVNSSTPAKTFLKLCDGFSSGNRFLELNLLKNSEYVTLSIPCISSGG